MRGGKTPYKKPTKKVYVPKPKATVDTSTDTTPPPVKDDESTSTAVVTAPVPVSVKSTGGPSQRGGPSTRGRPPGSGPARGGPPVRGRQQQILDTTAPPPGRGAPTTTTVSQLPPPPRLPTPGSNEPFDPGLIVAVQNNFDVATMKTLLTGLERETPRRPNLLNAVRNQVIRAQLRELMGGNITTLTNIHADGEFLGSTVPRVVGPHVKPDNERTIGTPRELTVWNTSLRDSEVDTIRDIKSWAGGFDPRGKADILMDLVGTSGPCEACQARMKDMARAILDYWSNEYGVPLSGLPQIRIVSYYGNNPNVSHKRGSYDTYNGWTTDQRVPEMAFTNKLNWNQFVQVHPMGSLNAPQPVAPPTTQPITVTPPTIRTGITPPLVTPPRIVVPTTVTPATTPPTDTSKPGQNPVVISKK